MGKVRSITACVVVTCAACTSFAQTAECGAPPLIAMSGAASAPLDTHPAIELWNPDGEAKVVTDDSAASSPALSPDGGTVAFALGEGAWTEGAGWDSSRVALMSLPSGDVSLLSAEVPGAEVSFLEWSTNGAEIAFLRSGPDGREIAAVDIETGEERRLLPLREGQQDFTWSPDGTEMLVPTRVPADGTTVVELRRYFLGSGHHIVVTVQSGIWNPAWSPDGRWVAMETFLPDTTELRLFLLDNETGELTPVDLRSGKPGPLTWSGPFLLYTYSAGPDSAPVLMSWDSRSQRRAPIERPGLERFLTGPISASNCDSVAV
jgi:Tol biopolymer transport system component